jgi:hypothetical protein
MGTRGYHAHAAYLAVDSLGGATVWGDEHVENIYEQMISLVFDSAMGYGYSTE